MIRGLFQFRQVSQTLQGTASQMRTPSASHTHCVETYGVTLVNSYEYVRGMVPMPPDPNKPRELATIVRGMAVNQCDERVSRVQLKITVHDDRGMKGAGTYDISELRPKQTQSFERAWMGNVTSWEIVPNK